MRMLRLGLIAVLLTCGSLAEARVIRAVPACSEVGADHPRVEAVFVARLLGSRPVIGMLRGHGGRGRVGTRLELEVLARYRGAVDGVVTVFHPGTRSPDRSPLLVAVERGLKGNLRVVKCGLWPDDDPVAVAWMAAHAHSSEEVSADEATVSVRAALAAGRLDEAVSGVQRLSNLGVPLGEQEPVGPDGAPVCESATGEPAELACAVAAALARRAGSRLAARAYREARRDFAQALQWRADHPLARTGLERLDRLAEEALLSARAHAHAGRPGAAERSYRVAEEAAAPGSATRQAALRERVTPRRR